MTGPDDEEKGEAMATGPVRAVVGLSVRLVRRSTLILAFALGAYAAVEVTTFRRTYPDQASRELLTSFGEDPALRMFQGVPFGTSIGALVAWDAGWILQLIVGVWAVATTARLLRADEDTGRSELLLVGTARSVRVLAAQLAVLVVACAVVGAGCGLGFVVVGMPVRGAVLFAALVTGLGAAYVTVTAVGCQVLAPRGRALGFGTVLLGAAFLLRMVANSADSRSWLAWFTPFGWIDHLRPFAADQGWALAVPVGVAVVLAGGALAMRRGRDHGAALLGERGSHTSRAWALTSPMGFAWRANLGVLVAWAAGVAIWGLIGGVLLPSMREFVAADESYREILVAFGMDPADVVRGFVAMTATLSAVMLSLYAAWRIGAARAEEATERLDLLLCRPVRRWRWLGGHVLLTAASVVLLGAAFCGGLLAGSDISGGGLAARDAVVGTANALPAVAVFLGVAVLTLGVAPRLTVGLAASLPIVTYVLQIVGPNLDWPDAVVGLSPFWHLAQAPMEPVAAMPVVVLLAIGVAGAAVGTVAFQRRDTVGS